MSFPVSCLIAYFDGSFLSFHFSLSFFSIISRESVFTFKKIVPVLKKNGKYQILYSEYKYASYSYCFTL